MGRWQAVLLPWPVLRPADWAGRVRRPLTEKAVVGWQKSLAGSRVFGDDGWMDGAVADTVQALAAGGWG